MFLAFFAKVDLHLIVVKKKICALEYFALCTELQVDRSPHFRFKIFYIFTCILHLVRVYFKLTVDHNGTSFQFT